MPSAADHQPASLKGRSNVNVASVVRSKGVPSAWRFIVLPSRAQMPTTNSDASILRCDAAHTVGGTNSQFVWSVQVGVQPHLAALAQFLQRHSGAEANSQASIEIAGADAVGADNAATPMTEVANFRKVDARYRALLAEAAHDIRAPLGVAQQILSRIASRVRTDRTLDHNEMRLLASANDRLQQAATWCEEILAPDRLESAHVTSIRQRFYPHQLKALVAPLVNSLAQRHKVQLNWVGWDHSLPRLYLDSNQLARVLMNLISNAIEASSAGSQLSVRVAWQTNVTQRLVIAIEDEGHGLESALLKFVNSDQSEIPVQAGIGLATVKSLVAAMGGSLSAQICQSGGTLLRITLPVDNRLSLIRGWLVQNAGQSAGSTDKRNGRIQLHVLRSSGFNTSLADQLLQQSAAPSDFVYRIADDRWLWLSIIQSPLDARASDSNSPISSKGAVERLSEQLTERMAVESGRLNCQLAFEWADIDLHALHNSLNQRNLLPQLSAAIADKFMQLTGNRIPPINELNGELISDRTNNRDLDTAAARRPVVQTRNFGTVRVDSAEANPLAAKRHGDANLSPERLHNLASSFLNSDPSQFAELAQDWRAQLSELQRPAN